MVIVWFLMALMSYPELPGVIYKGYGGFLSMKECEEKRILIENGIAQFEIERGNTVYIETYCMEFKAFESQLRKKNRKLEATNLGQWYDNETDTLDENLDDEYHIKV